MIQSNGIIYKTVSIQTVLSNLLIKEKYSKVNYQIYGRRNAKTAAAMATDASKREKSNTAAYMVVELKRSNLC